MTRVEKENMKRWINSISKRGKTEVFAEEFFQESLSSAVKLSFVVWIKIWSIVSCHAYIRGLVVRSRLISFFPLFCLSSKRDYTQKRIVRTRGTELLLAYEGRTSRFCIFAFNGAPWMALARESAMLVCENEGGRTSWKVTRDLPTSFLPAIPEKKRYILILYMYIE